MTTRQVRDTRHLGILAHSAEGAALCFRAFCQEGFARLGPHEHPDVTLDCIALARSMPAWDRGDHGAVRATLAESVRRLARAGADFFVCPDNTAHLALEVPGPELALGGLHIAEVVADQAARDGHRQVGVLGTRFTMDGPIYPRVLAARGIAARLPGPDDRHTVDRIIFDELVNGVLTDRSRTPRCPRSTRPGCWPGRPWTSPSATGPCPAGAADRSIRRAGPRGRPGIRPGGVAGGPSGRGRRR